MPKQVHNNAATSTRIFCLVTTLLSDNTVISLLKLGLLLRPLTRASPAAQISTPFLTVLVSPLRPMLATVTRNLLRQLVILASRL